MPSLSLPELSAVDRKKGLSLPTSVDSNLAYLVGVLAGDGNIFVRKKKKDYRIKCVGHPIDEKSFYDDLLQGILQKTFSMHVPMKPQDSNTTYGFYIYSKALVSYLTENFGLPVGKKKDKLHIPALLLNTPFVFDYLRGLADTDFCISFKKQGSYPCIAGGSNSEAFIKEISAVLKKEGFRFYECYNYKLLDTRFREGYSLINRIEIGGWKHLEKWMRLIGFSSPKHLRKIKSSCGFEPQPPNSGEWTFRRAP